MKPSELLLIVSCLSLLIFGMIAELYFTPFIGFMLLLSNICAVSAAIKIGLNNRQTNKSN